MNTASPNLFCPHCAYALDAWIEPRLAEAEAAGRAAGWRAGVEAMRDALLGVYSMDVPNYKSFLDTLVTCLLAEGEGGKS